MNTKYTPKAFDNSQGRFDVHDTPLGHEKRFLQRLEASKPIAKKENRWWKPLSIAASIVVLLGFGFTFMPGTAQEADLASVSSEMKQTQTFFTTTINKELDKLKSYSTPATKALVDDALAQMEILETEYAKLKEDLVASGNDKRVIYAMISNFQNRIDLLEQVISTIEEVENLNNTQHESTI
ncbi:MULTISPECIES: hypothetical protein [Altibacter]|uniref:hypothetical protein n=1 Tax=Altibacter TaxID=1535231 RepID=UPI0005550D4E|nr:MULTISPECIES: hypothetical protein [Altibacter]MCW8980516.1 hypothetical protein [Altibacter sp.]MCW9037562.1 hypothetical protein [Altibacter sp.]